MMLETLSRIPLLARVVILGVEVVRTSLFGFAVAGHACQDADEAA